MSIVPLAPVNRAARINAKRRGPVPDPALGDGTVPDAELRAALETLPPGYRLALPRAGVTSLEQVAAMTDDELLALPKVGPATVARAARCAGRAGGAGVSAPRQKARQPGIEVRHAKKCPGARADGRRCGPTYRAHVYDARTEQRIRRQLRHPHRCEAVAAGRARRAQARRGRRPDPEQGSDRC